jgi:UDP-N-acetyl-D-mannosaminouronate:lipid I N-acetyl-D-mannosaminouronosyltransferase
LKIVQWFYHEKSFYLVGSKQQITEETQLIDDIVTKNPDVVFVAITRHVERAPRWWLNHNLEFAYRLLKQPKRITRQIHLLRYAYWLVARKL